MKHPLQLKTILISTVFILVSILLSVTSWADFLVTTSSGKALAGQKVYVFTETGAYTRNSATTGEAGLAEFNPETFEEGIYRFRTDYLGYQFWTDFVSQPDSVTIPLEIPEQTIPVNVTLTSGPVSGVKVYLFTESGS